MDDGKEIAIAIATEVAKQVPVKAAYDDAVSPGAKQVGAFVEDLAKAIRLTLFPIPVMAAMYDRFERLLNKSIRGIPEDDIVAPAPQVLGPVLEAVRYEPEDSPIDEMFSALLNKSMSKSQLRYAHPSFPLLIRQLSQDEAAILHRTAAAWKNGAFPKLRTARYYDYSTTPSTWKEPEWELDELQHRTLDFPDNLELYLLHLISMGICNVGILSIDRLPPGTDTEMATGQRETREIRLTEFGHQFMLAVTR